MSAAEQSKIEDDARGRHRARPQTFYDRDESRWAQRAAGILVLEGCPCGGLLSDDDGESWPHCTTCGRQPSEEDDG